MIGRLVSVVLLGLVVAIFAAFFVEMAQIVATQEQLARFDRSEIDPWPVRKERADPLAEARTRGREVYQRNCQHCHGEKGRRDGLGHAEPDFTDAKFWQQLNDEQAYYAIALGPRTRGTSMPAFEDTLTQEQIRDVILYLHSFAVRHRLATVREE